MDKKKLRKPTEEEDLKGFEEFIQGQSDDSNLLARGVIGSTKKNETGFEHFTFLSNDSLRLTKLKNLLCTSLPFSAKFDQVPKISKDQKEETEGLRKKIFEYSDRIDSPYRKSLSEIFNGFFSPPND
jgi:hypothetical protein